MTRLTVSIDPVLLDRARKRAIRENTSVGVILRDWLERYAAGEVETPGVRPIDAFLELAREGGCKSGPRGRRWTRDEIHGR